MMTLIEVNMQRALNDSLTLLEIAIEERAVHTSTGPSLSDTVATRGEGIHSV